MQRPCADGTWIQLNEMPHNAETEAYVGIALLALPQSLASIRVTEPEAEGYYVASAEARFTHALPYLGLAAFLAVMCYDLSLELPRH